MKDIVPGRKCPSPTPESLPGISKESDTGPKTQVAGWTAARKQQSCRVRPHSCWLSSPSTTSTSLCERHGRGFEFTNATRSVLNRPLELLGVGQEQLAPESNLKVCNQARVFRLVCLRQSVIDPIAISSILNQTGVFEVGQMPGG